MMFRSIRWRLVLSYVLLTLLTVGVVGVLALSLVKGYVERQESAHLTANAGAVARQALPLMWPVARQGELRALAQTSSFLGNVRVRILDGHQRVLADSGPRAEEDEFVWVLPPGAARIGLAEEPTWSFIMAMPDGHMPHVSIEQERFFYDQLPPDAAYMIVLRRDGVWGTRFHFETKEGELLSSPPSGWEAAPRSERSITVPIGEAKSPLGFVELSSGLGFGTEALATTRRAFFLAACGASLLAVVVGLLVSRGLSAPLRDLAVVAGQMSGGDLSTRAPVRRKDEIGQLAEQFNQMAERLEASFAELAAERDSLRAFIADASHELRTPITALKNFNELLQGVAADDPTARAEFLVESKVQLDRLEWITSNLLDLSRLEAGLVALDLARHDVGELIQAVTSAFEVLAQEKGIAFSVRLPETRLELDCDRTRIELALSNLLDNAIKFTPAGGQVEIGATRAGEVARLWVQDTGRGIDPSDLPHIFERFYRGRNGDVEGSGLGLAIVHSVARLHQGQVSVESAPGTGSRFVVELPLAQPAKEA